MPRCLVFGDSNSYGWPPEWRRGETVVWPGNTAWPKVMAAELGPDWDVVTDALPGRLTVHDDSVEGGMRNGLPFYNLRCTPMVLWICSSLCWGPTT
jgi:lysophospholipase L1-like esterase